jgi:hypothetical protein
MYFSVNLDQFQTVECVLQTNGGFVQQLKGLKMKKIVASFITGVLAVSAFAATPRTAPVGKAVETQNASHSSSKHLTKVSHKVDHGSKHHKLTPTAKSVAVIK